MRKFPLLFLFAFIWSLSVSALEKRILFIGNSYTYVNDLPNTLKSIALSFNDSIYFDQSVPGGYTLLAHTTNTTTLSKIQLGNWDYVVLQAQSQEPSFSPGQVQSDTYPYAAFLDSAINANNTCAETVFYMTWGRKNGDASNCANYPPICTYAGMQQRLRESYLEMSQLNHGSVAPVGVAWKNCRDSYPNIELYNPDESHPSVHGTYLAACVFYASIFHKSCIGSGFIPTGISASDAQILQTIASNTVLDSLENWQQYGDIPKAMFGSTTIVDSVHFMNQSLRYASVWWDFGDGTATTMNNPIHHYTNNGSYLVTLVALSACGKTDTFKQIINFNLPTGISTSSVSEFKWYIKDKVLTVFNQSGKMIEIYDLNGQRLMKTKIKEDEFKIELQHLPSSLYIMKIGGQQNVKDSFQFKL